jgi:hypothetical protein
MRVVDDAVNGDSAEVVLLGRIGEGFLVGGVAAEEEGLRRVG